MKFNDVMVSSVAFHLAVYLEAALGSLEHVDAKTLF